MAADPLPLPLRGGDCSPLWGGAGWGLLGCGTCVDFPGWRRGGPSLGRSHPRRSAERGHCTVDRAGVAREEGASQVRGVSKRREGWPVWKAAQGLRKLRTKKWPPGHWDNLDGSSLSGRARMEPALEWVEQQTAAKGLVRATIGDILGSVSAKASREMGAVGGSKKDFAQLWSIQNCISQHMSLTYRRGGSDNDGEGLVQGQRPW